MGEGVGWGPQKPPGPSCSLPPPGVRLWGPRSVWSAVTPGGRKLSTEWAQEGPTLGTPSPSPADPPALTLNPMPPFLQHRQASMRAMTVKSPEKDTATTAREDDQESSLRGAPSAEGEGVTGQPPWPCPPCSPCPSSCTRGLAEPLTPRPTPTHRGLSLSTLTPC